MRRFQLITFLSILMILVAALFPTGKISAANAITASDLIGLVNGMRSANGLPALSVNSILMSTAQSTAATMAANGSCGHIGDVKGRVSAAGYGAGKIIFATENIACGNVITISDIQSFWSDYWHMLPMTEVSYTDIGAGVYETGSMSYYVIQVAYVSGQENTSRTTSPTSSSNTSSNTAATDSGISQYIYGVVTATAQKDGAISHVVEYGQALSSIAVAYGVTVNQLKELNGLTSNNIYVGQVLIIRKAPTPTVSPTRTVTPVRPTRTTTATPVPTTPSPTRTITPTSPPTLKDTLEKVDRPTVGLALVGISGVGLLAIIIASFVKKKPK